MTVLQDVFDGAASALAGALQNAGPEFAPVAIAVTAVDGLVDADFGIIAASSGNSDNYETGLALAAEALGFAAALAAGTAAAPLIAPAVAAWGLTGAAATVAEYIALSAAGVGYGGIVSDAAEELGNFIRGALPQIPSWIDRTTGGVNNAQNDPLIFNMSGTGLTLKSTSETSPFFDFTGSGVAEQTAWLGAGNGLLTTAVPGLGSTSGLLTTFAQLVSFDTNGDGVISGQELDNIFYWSDANSDGAAEQGEISSLSDLGVVSIALATKELNEAIVGGVIEQEAVATMSDGSTREIASVQLQANPLSTIYTGAYSLTSAVEDLLNFKGYGALPDLRISMSQSDQLLDLVKTLQATDPNDSAAFDSSLQAVLYQWAGVGNVEPGSGQLFDGQKLAFLQALTNNYQSFFGTVEPHFIGQANYLQESWDSAFAALKARALVQTPSSPFGVDFVYTIALDAIVPTVSFTAAITDLASNVPADSQARVAYWSNALDIINESVLSLSSIIAVDSSAIAAQLQAVLPPSFSASQISAAASGNLSFVEGTALTKVLVGTIGSDLFQATAPGTELEGFGGGDLFIVETGLGSTEVNEIDNVAHPSNILLIEGVEPAQVTVSGDAAGDIILSLGDGSSIKIDEMLFQASYQSENAQGHNSIGANNQTAFGVQEVEFADGTVWTAAKVQAAEVADQAGNTSIYGTSGSDLIDGRGIATYEQGNGGGDTFVYDQGYGQLEIDEVDPSALPDNVLRFGAGITADEVTVMGDSLGDVTLTDGTTGDRIQIDGMLNSAKDGVQAIDFADGSVWTTAQILSLATTGTTGSDDLYGTSGANVFDGKGDSDYEQGDGGGDTFIFNQGYGTLEVNEYDTSRSNTNILALGTGINAVDLQISGDAAGDIVIKTGEAVDAIILENMLVSGRYGVQGVAFADGTVWTAAQVEALATTGTPGSDNLYGTSGPDTFDGKGGSDYEQGNGGGDTFIFNAGSGSLEINEQDSNPNNYNILTFGSGIQTSDIAVGADATGDVILTVGSGGDRVQIDNMLDGPQYGVQAVAFADGTVWSAASIVAGLPAGTAPRSSDYAQSLAFAEGDGPVTSNPIPGEIVAGEGISAANLILQSDAGGDLILKIEGTTDGLTVRDDFTYQSSGVVSQISGIRLADGSLIELPTYTQHEPADFTWQGSSTDLSLSGSNYGDNTFDLAPGGDTVTFGNSSDGGPGTNSVLFDKGDGNALINLDGGTGAITLAADIESSDVVLQADNTGDLTIELLDTGETLTVIDDLTPSSSIGAIGVSSSINELHFSDGSKVSLSAETGTNTPLVFTWIGSATDHTLVGSDLGSNTFIPGADGDSVTFGSRSVVGAATNLLNYSIGNGRVTLDLNGGTGAVEMGIGITQANLTFQADAVGDLTILDGTAGDSVVIENDLFSDKYGWNARLGAVNFSDGTSEAFNGGMTFTWTGTAVNTVLTGSGFGANVFNLAPGGDTVTLGNGSGSGSNRNTVNYGPGDGAATINMNGDNGSATLVFGKGITASDLIFQVDDSTGNLTILDGVAGDRVIIESDLFSDKYGWNARLSALSFGNGTAEVLSSGITFTWTGTATNTVLTGSGFGANVFNVAPGGDTVTLGNGSDSGSTKNTVNYGAGDGAATIDLNGNNGNATLAFGAGITASDLTFQSDAAGDLIILDGTAGDSVVIKDALYLDNFGGGVRLNNLTFSDGASKSLSIGMTFTWTATATATVLTGSGFGANVFNLAPGSDSVTFGNGSQSGSNWNTVNFAAGDGAVTINMNGASGALVLGTGIQISDLVFGQNAQGNETVAIDNTGDEVTFTNVSSNPLIDVDFDGAIYTAFVGASGNDRLYGSNSADVFDGRGGSDYEQGYGGGDIFIYNAGYGQLEINENGSGLNVLQVGGGITAAGVQVSDDNNGNVFLTDGVSGDRIQLDGELYGVGSGVEQVQFADGTVLSQSQLLAMATTGSSAGESLYGTGGAELFDSKGLATYERGNGGGDIFLYNAGYGQLEINENGSGLNLLQVGGGITAAGVQVSDDRNGNVFLTDGVGGDRIQLDGELYGVGSGVEQVQFADGTTWTQAQLVTMATTGTSAGQGLYGNGNANVFDSKGLATYEQGNGGGDTFIYNAGYGQLEINENGNGLNVLQLGNGITAAGVQVSDDRNGNVFLTDGV
ncbi:beta strand repeat-containing protein, partial [Lichenicoccus roseus]